jgi:hypothetical protein
MAGDDGGDEATGAFAAISVAFFPKVLFVTNPLGLTCAPRSEDI